MGSRSPLDLISQGMLTSMFSAYERSDTLATSWRETSFKTQTASAALQIQLNFLPFENGQEITFCISRFHLLQHEICFCMSWYTWPVESWRILLRFRCMLTPFPSEQRWGSGKLTKIGFDLGTDIACIFLSRLVCCKQVSEIMKAFKVDINHQTHGLCDMTRLDNSVDLNLVFCSWRPHLGLVGC